MTDPVTFWVEKYFGDRPMPIQERIIRAAMRIRDENREIDDQQAVTQSFILLCQIDNKFMEVL